MANHQTTYTTEFNEEAVRLMKTSGRSAAQIAHDLGVSDSAVYHWRKQLRHQGEQAFPGHGHQTAPEEELRRLRRENEILRQERAILKKWLPSSPRNRDDLPIHPRSCPTVASKPTLSDIGRLRQRLVCLAASPTESA